MILPGHGHSSALTELQRRWSHVLRATDKAVRDHPTHYDQIKTMAANVVSQPLDIKAYLPTTETLARLLHQMDPAGSGSIFYLFGDRFRPRTIWQIRLFRLECNDLLAHLTAFDQWRRESHRLRVVK